MKQKIKVGLALGGGGARGLAHIGVLKALEEEKIPIHAIAGTSMGAKFLSHEGEKNKEKKESLLKELGYFVRRRLIYVVGASRISLEHQEKLMEPLKTAVRDEPIENAKIPFAAVAIDLVSGREVVIKKRSMINALYASSSIEGIFPPLRLDNQLLSDGGVASLVPVDAVRELGANFVIGVSIPEKIRQETEFGSGIEVILRADALTRNKLNDLMLKDCDVVITPEVRTIHWANFGKLDECIQKGYDATKSKIKEIKEKMERKRSLWNKVRKSLAQAIAGKE